MGRAQNIFTPKNINCVGGLQPFPRDSNDKDFGSHCWMTGTIKLIRILC